MDKCQVCGKPFLPNEEPQVCAEPDCGRIGHARCGGYDYEPSGAEFWRCNPCWDRALEAEDAEFEEAERHVL